MLNPSGICQCGCGQPAPLAEQTVTKLGYVRGEPVRFIRGHVGNLSRRERLTEADWTVEDRGFSSPCWIWDGSDERGYCRVLFQGRRQLVHRAMHEQEIGPIPDGYDVDHLCRQRGCVNPEHLEAVTRAENIRRSRTAKLTAADRELILSSDLPHRTLARQLGVAPQTVANVRSGHTWS